MASNKGLLRPRRWHSISLPPTMSEVRIVLLGRNVPLTNRVGNFILGRSAFETEDLLHSVKLHSERATGHVEGRTITIINTPHLYNPHLSQEELTRRVKECISLADPGPHVFLLVLQSEFITHEQQDRVRSVLATYSPLSRERSIVLTTGEDHGFISECEVKPHRIENISTFDKHQVLQLLGKIDGVVKETGGSDLHEENHSETLRRYQDPVTENTAQTDGDRIRIKLEENKVSGLRIILLGKSLSDTSSVGNFILGRSVFENEDPLHSVEFQCERVRGHVEGRYITIINAPHLFQQNLSHHQLTQRIKECVSLSAPGPHVIMIIVQPESFTEADKTRLDKILSSLSEEAHKYTLVVTTEKTELGSSVDQDEENVIQKIIAEGIYRHLEFTGCSRANLVEKMDEMVKVNKGSLFCDVFEDAEPAVGQKLSEKIVGQEEHQETEEQEEHIQTKKNNQPTKQTHKKDTIMDTFKRLVLKRQPSESKQTPQLKLVLLGKERVNASISKTLLGKKASVIQTESSLMCIKQGEVHGYLITLVEMSALHNTQLSEQEVMRQTLHCVSVCDPGVHAFFIIVPEGPLTDEDKREIELIQKIFSSRVNDHTIFIINQQSQKKPSDETLQSVIKACGGQYKFYSSRTKAAELITCVEQLLKQNSSHLYTMAMYYEAQLEVQLQYKREIKNLKHQVTELKRNRNQTQDLLKDPDTLRIVLLGKTGVGKSASGNTILGKEVFKEGLSDESVTSVCQKETVEGNKRQITVIDTPGLFDTNIDNDETKKEIIKCISMAAPGPHVFLLVLKLGTRFTQEEKETVKIIEKTFGQKSNIYTIVLFTGGDQLKGRNIEEYIEKAGPWLKKLLLDFGNRYHVFNNNDKSSNTQVLGLLDKIDSMVKVNGGSCYTNEMFQEVEEALEEEKERILKEREEQIEREKEELKTKYEEQMEEMRTKMQKQKEHQEAEGKRKEEEFKQKEEKIKREMSEREEQVREDFRKRREDDDLKMKEWMQEINREREENRKQWERQREEDQKRRDQEEEERRRTGQELKEKQREENERIKREKEEMENNKEKELKKLQQEYEQKAAKEEKRKRDLEEKIKDAEESKKKELQDLQLSQQHEWERRMKEVEEKRKQQQKNWEEKIAALEKKRNLDQVRKQKQYEWEKLREKERDLKEKERKEKEEQEKKRIENDYNEKIRKMEEQLKEQREKDERERKEKDEEHKKEMEELQKQQEEFRKEKEEEERRQNEEKERNLAFIKEQHKTQLENLKIQTEQAARRQAEEEFTAKLDEKVKEAKEEGFEEGCAKVEAERTKPGRAVDRIVNTWLKKKNE